MGTVAALPYVDPTVAHVGISKLRTLNAERLRNIKKTWVIQENDEPVAVVLKYEDFLQMQDQRLRSVRQFLYDGEIAALEAGLRDLAAGRTKPISEIRESVKRSRRSRGRQARDG